MEREMSAESISTNGRFINVVITIYIAVFLAGEVDLFIPSMPDMLVYFSATEEELQRIVSINYLGLCLGVVSGVLSDAYGRRPIHLIGVGLFALGSTGCFFSDSLDMMVFWRFIQGIGAGIPFALAPALIMDMYEPSEALKKCALFNGIVTVFIALAPVTGAFINQYLGWQAVFGTIMLGAVVGFALYITLFTETLPKPKRKEFHIKQFASYGKLSMDYTYMYFMLIFCFLYTAIMLFVSNVSLVYVNHYGVKESLIGIYQASSIGSFCVVSLLSQMIIKKFGETRSVYVSLNAVLIGVGLFGYLSFIDSSDPILYSLGMFLIGGGSAIPIPYFYLKAMSGFPDDVGAASALGCAMRLAISALLIYVCGLYFDGTMAPVAVAFLFMTAFILIARLPILKMQVSSNA